MSATARQALRRNVDASGYTNATKQYDIPSRENPDGTLNIPAQAVFGIDPNREPIDHYMAVRQYPVAVPLQQFSNANAIGATGFNFGIVAANRSGQYQCLTCDVATSAAVGNRIIQARLWNGANTLWIGPASAATAASQVCGYDIYFGVASPSVSTTVRRNYGNTANTNVQVVACCPILDIPAGYFINIDDSANIDNADTVTGVLTYKDFAV